MRLNLFASAKNMTTTKAETNELPPLEISPLYSDCTIQVPLDDRSGFQTYNLHLCMLYDSPYFEKMVPNPKKVHSIPALKSHFEIILRYIYNKKQIFYNDDNILDLITEGYRFQLPSFVSRLWSEFATSATAPMVIDALKRIENQHEFTKQYDTPSLQTAIKRNVLSVFVMSEELKKPQSIQLLMDLADNQNPDVILKKLQQWGESHRGRGKAAINRSVQTFQDTFLTRFSKKNDTTEASQNGVLTQVFSMKDFSKDVRSYSQESSTMISVPCDVGTTKHKHGNFTIDSISPLQAIINPEFSLIHNGYILRLWDKERTFYISKLVQNPGTCRKVLGYDILNAHEWANDDKLLFELIRFNNYEISNNTPKEPVEPLLAFSYPPNREKLSDFTVTCQGEKGPVVHKLHKFILQQSPHFKRMFSMSSSIEAKTSKATIETPQHLFEVILRYLYDQEPLKGISSIITDVILEASYFDLSDFENELWSLFEREADVANCIKAINLIDVNMHFKARQPNVMRIVAKHIKAVLQQICEVPDWLMVRTILNLKCTKKQNPLLILESVKHWCKSHEPKNCEKRIREIFSKIKRNDIPQMIAKELQAKYPYLTGVSLVNTDFNTTETFFLQEGQTANLQAFSNLDCISVSLTGELKRTKSYHRNEEIRLHDQLSSYYIVVEDGTDLNQVVENIEEWNYGGCYRISVTF